MSETKSWFSGEWKRYSINILSASLALFQYVYQTRKIVRTLSTANTLWNEWRTSRTQKKKRLRNRSMEKSSAWMRSLRSHSSQQHFMERETNSLAKLYLFFQFFFFLFLLLRSSFSVFTKSSLKKDHIFWLVFRDWRVVCVFVCVAKRSEMDGCCTSNFEQRIFFFTPIFVCCFFFASSNEIIANLTHRANDCTAKRSDYTHTHTHTHSHRHKM